MRAISLIGLMGSGKTEVGRSLAARLGWEFVDTDTDVEAREGRSISRIFAESGEARFRAVERAVVRAATRRRLRVIATGGGAVLSAASRLALRRAGPVFYLKAPVGVLLERVGGDAGRPLLGDDPRAALGRLLEQREGLYAETGDPIDAARPVDAIVAEILARLDSAQRRVRVGLGTRAYDVVIGAGVLALLGVDVLGLGAGGRAALVTQRPLLRRFGGVVVRTLEGAGFTVHSMTMPVGERAKSLRQASVLIDEFAGMGLSRSDTVIAMGGGVVGDLAGFAAAVYMRGVRLIQVPTTLLAQVDSSIGGKTAVNHPRAKNLVGAFHQPALVLSDVDTLASLPLRERRAGLAEAVKYAMTLDRGFFDRLERDAASGLGRPAPRNLEEIVTRCAELKAQVVVEDEFERGPREVLNYGHTVGHALEAALWHRVIHGEAVAMGMQVEARLAMRLGLLEAADADRQTALLLRLGLPVVIPPGPIDVLLEPLRLDKKRRVGRIRCTLPEGIGRARLGVEVPDRLMEEVMRACQESS